eukprot:CAMPEP_0185491586 /NCGR_PEP_ID=MMETSP1366-20130426/14816_1 /TAXON_ID=38817 /ORGANISM="Gephyrocapsa oceanica, Strain RCC1303" /LENGTH=207 /DNA_ID=CAMNT_0028100365 /DNA_START=45 /DNA_END=665 /DNA_ORIENTATION=+
MNQCLAWFSFSSVSREHAEEYFGRRLTQSTVDQLLNWGPIIGVLCFHAQTTVLQRPRGLQRGIWWGNLLLLGGNMLRCIPIAVTEASGGARPRFAESGAAFAMYHAGQILIAAAGPFFMGSVTRLAVVWFPQSERTTATAIAQTSNALGSTVGFLNPLWLAPSPAAIPNVFWLSLGLAAASVACAVVYLPAAPPLPPSGPPPAPPPA